jgi:uncharacterized protein GlcG (DUF336 family)
MRVFGKFFDRSRETAKCRLRARRSRLAVERLEDRTLLSSANNALFVTRVYQSLLNRSPEPAVQAATASALNRSALSRIQEANNILASLEYRTIEVTRLYQQYLHRVPDLGGLNSGIGFLAGGGTVEQLAAILAGSQEYFQNRGGGTINGFLNAFYHDALNRPVDPAAQALFGPQLAQGTTPGQVATAVLNSPEYQFDLVGGFYNQFLHRTPDLPGQTSYVSELQNGSRDEDIIAQIVTSDEFTPEATEPSFLSIEEVQQLIERAAGASPHNDAIIAVVDRGGRVLGVRVESGVSTNITANPTNLVFAIDGALAEARTAAFFANDTAPLTSRTVQFISQSTITQREVESNPSIADLNSPFRGPGFVAPVGLGGHFPPNVPFTPPVDLFGIEHTNRDSILHPGMDHLKTDGVMLPSRFNVQPQFIPQYFPTSSLLVPPESYGFISGMEMTAQARGIGTLPGGIPLFKKDVTGVSHLVGGIGVFFPGKTGFATEENSSLSATFNPALPDRSLEAEYMAFAAAGGSSGAQAAVGTIAGIPALRGFDLPFGRIDLAGVTLDIFGPGGDSGPATLLQVGAALGNGIGNPNDGTPEPIGPGPTFFQDGVPVPEGWLVLPHDSSNGLITRADVIQIIQQGIAEANLVRAQIRLPVGNRTRMVFAVTDTNTGDVLGLYRMADATVFSIDVAVAKGRNVAYYDNSQQLQAMTDQIAGLPNNVAFTNRTFRYVAQPRYPEGIDGTPPGPMSILNDPGINPTNGLDSGPPLPASVYQSAYGFDSFNPGSNFHDPFNFKNQNGVVFFPGSSVMYKTINGVQTLVGGVGVSGDGVDQDDVITAFAAAGYEPPVALRADQFILRGVRLPYQKFPRNPGG